MNLHGIAAGAVGTVNPFISAQVFPSTGYTTAPDGSRVPGYAAPVTVAIQKQEMSFKDLQHVDGLNLQGIFCSVYLAGAIYGVDRGTARGGDKFVFAGQTWLVVAVPEQWPDWCRVILCLQVTP
ncbi:MAG TPA: hypothetical protein VGU03_10870 [Frateuria sp.]|uniref:hypothetical protein n=1 Tax=Frateuria sp. TaxID=2211372 RepID=UPI002DF43701|nr:hypothetical protein [Frateuria sp.]